MSPSLISAAANMAGAPPPHCQIVAVPYPGRGHINPMLHLCRLILNSRPQILVSFVVTEEWLSLLAASPPPPNFSFHTIPNVIPSEIGRAKDLAGFCEAVLTKMEAPVEQLLDRLPPPQPSVIIYDTLLSWTAALGNRRNIPVASFYPMSPVIFSIYHHFDRIFQSRDFPSTFADENSKEQIISNIPGVPSMKISDLPTTIHGEGHQLLPQILEAIKTAQKVQYLLFATVHELESQVLEALKQSLPLKIYSLGLAIPHSDVESSTPTVDNEPRYLEWLDAQPKGSVLYISQGSYLSFSNAQLEEIMAGLLASGVRFLWAGRLEKDEYGGGKGLVVPWCDQLKVLSHPSVGGFWSHCGWNSTKEGAFAGLPMLTFPIMRDQVTNSKLIVDVWKIGLRVKKGGQSLVGRDDVAEAVMEVMDSDGVEAKERRRRAKKIREVCRSASSEGGSSHVDVMAFIRDVCDCS